MNNSIFESKDIPDKAIGFVYLITNLSSNRMYVGKKFFYSTKRLPPLKGKTRKRTKITESDWQDYFGSSTQLSNDVEMIGKDKFKREILHICYSKGMLSYLELKEQMEREVLLSDDYYNGIINVRINASHLK